VEVESTPEETTEETQVITPEMFNTLQAQFDQIKASQAGSDKNYQKASKALAESKAENERLAKEKMTAEEQSKYNLEQDKAEIAESKRELAEATLRLTKIKAMDAAGISAKYEDNILGSTDDEIENAVLKFKKNKEEDRQNDFKDHLAKSPKPGSGDPPKGSVDQDSLTDTEMIALAEKGELDF